MQGPIQLSTNSATRASFGLLRLVEHRNLRADRKALRGGEELAFDRDDLAGHGLETNARPIARVVPVGNLPVTNHFAGGAFRIGREDQGAPGQVACEQQTTHAQREQQPGCEVEDSESHLHDSRNHNRFASLFDVGSTMSEPEKKGSKWPWILVPIAAFSVFFGLRECQHRLPPAEQAAPADPAPQ